VVVRGSLSTSNIVGDLTMQSGGRIRTSASGARVELSSGAAGFVDFYAPNGDKTTISSSNGSVVGGVLTIGGGGIATDFGFFVSESGAITSGAIEATTVQATSITDSSNVATGSIITAGGVGIAKRLNVGGALNAPIVTVKAVVSVSTPYTVLATDTHIAVDNGASAFTVNLPAGTEGRKVTIYDNIGGAGVGSEITINRASTDTINGATSIQLSTQYESATLLFSGTNWTRI